MRLTTIAFILFVGYAISAQAQEDDPLAELANLGDSVAEMTEEGGGSIRAKKDADLTRSKRLKDRKNFEAKVEDIKIGKFPIVALKLRVIKEAKDGAGKSVKRNEELVIIPKLKIKGGKVALDDADTLINAGSYYLQQGDKVMVRLGKQKGKVWEADYIERK
ncbi:MAG: hypothetical protein JW841_05180 [Deltaproteobacteria bacterium]|nr:hypothetical protein [Deltaproteobacteria bacterium]